jgi:hypothetical protein
MQFASANAGATNASALAMRFGWLAIFRGVSGGCVGIAAKLDEDGDKKDDSDRRGDIHPR